MGGVDNSLISTFAICDSEYHGFSSQSLRIQVRPRASRSFVHICLDRPKPGGKQAHRATHSCPCNRLNIRRPKKKSNVLNDKRIKSCLSRFDGGACSRLQFLRAVSHCVGADTESLQPRVDNRSNSNSSEDEEENRPTSGASESATSAAATTSDDCCKVCIVASRAGFALVPCGHTRTQYTRRRNDDEENFYKLVYQSITRSITIL